MLRPILKHSVFVLLYCFASVFSIAATCIAADDSQSWTFLNFNLFKFYRHTTNVEPQVRFYSDMEEFGFFQTRLAQNYRATDSFQVGIGQSFLREESSQKFNNEYRSDLELQHRLPLAAYTLINRVRLEYRVQYRTPQNDFGRFRHQIQLDLPESGGIRPFLLTEYFYHLEQDVLNQQRYFVGVLMPFLDTTKLNLAVGLRRDLRDERWNDIVVFQAGVRF